MKRIFSGLRECYGVGLIVLLPLSWFFHWALVALFLLFLPNLIILVTSERSDRRRRLREYR